ERKAKSILLLAIPDEYQLRFHGIKDANSLWAAIKSRFGGNVESKKMQKTVLRQQFEKKIVSDTEGLDKAYDRFQKLISLLEVHGATVPNENANQKFLRALPSSWNNVALIMRNKDGIDDLDIDDLYNNLKVFEVVIKGSSGSSLNSQNVAFLSTEDTSSINEVNTANVSNSPQLDDEDLEQIDHDDLEEMDLKWQVAMISMRVKRFYKKTGRKLIFNGKEPVGYRSRDNTRRTKVETSDALVVQDNALIVQDGLGYDWSLESVEAQLVVHQKNKVVYEENITVLEFEVKDKINAVTRLKNQLDETLREKDDLKAKLEQFETSSKNLNKLIISQISSKDKTGLGYGDQLNENDSSGSELFNSIFDSRSSDGYDNQTNDRLDEDDSVYRPTTNKTSASVSQVETSISQTSNTLKCLELNLLGLVKLSLKIGLGQAPNTRISNEKVNTVKVNGVNTVGQTAVSTVKGTGVTAVKASTGYVWRPKMTDLNNLLDESQVLLRVPRQSNMYIFDSKNVVPSGDLTCLFAKAIIDESKLWHRRLSHVNFKIMNKLVKGNLVRGLPLKIFDNDHTCVACQKGKQHKASCKAKLMSSISQPL
ncbi:putative ribonuclease H-like domain-containing protein, partial [Tanacetum coccineum]